MSPPEIPAPEYMRPDAAAEPRLLRLRAQLEGLTATVRLAQSLAVGGERIDLTGLDDQVGRICAGVLDLPQAEGQGLRADMLQLGTHLAALHDVLCAATDGRTGE